MIRAQNPQTVVDGGFAMSGKADQLDGIIGDQVRAVHSLEESWQGKAANAARGRAYQNLQRQHRVHEIVAAMATAMTNGGRTLVTVRDTLLHWVSTISQMFDVSDDGVVTPRSPLNESAWATTAAAFTTCTQNLIKAFTTTDQQLAASLKTIADGNIPSNDPKKVPGFGPGIDPDGFNNGQITFDQEMAGFGDATTGQGGVGVPNTDLSIMGITPDGRLFTMQGDTGTGMNPKSNGGPGPRLTDGGNNSIIYWKMDEHGKWVPDEVVKNPFPTQKGPDGTDAISTIPTSTFNVGDTMYASVMNVDHWNGAEKRPPGESGWATNSSQLYKSTDGGKSWQPAGPRWDNTDDYKNPFQVQSFAPSNDGKYVYMYGTEDGRTNDGLHVARVPANAVGDQSQYQYWNGSSFDVNQSPHTSPPLVQTPPGITGIGEPNVHFYDNKALMTFNDEHGGVYTSSSTDGGVSWTPPTRVAEQGGTYGVFQSPFSGGDSISSTLSLWNPYGTALYDITNKDTQNLGAY
jgi:Domain of unknown function (DUF4185)